MSGMSIREEYISTHPKSQELFQRALKTIAGGVSHDGRYVEPFPLYIAKALGSKLWDVDGKEYIDYHVGNECLLIGHRHPAVVAAIKEQLEIGINYGACHELEVKLAELVIETIPGAELVRFSGSGAEANMLAIRLARAYTGKKDVIKFRGHWHGGFSEGFIAVKAPFDAPYSAGVPQVNTLLADHNSSDDVRRLIDSGDVACVIMEPFGAHTGIMPNRPGFLEEVRQITEEKGVVLIFDEVLTGFRYAPGGAQELLGVAPDLTSLGKSLGGGLPVSAVVGKKEIMDLLSFTGDPEHDRFQRVRCQGTHSGNILAFSAAVATLEILKRGDVQAHINKLGAMLREGMNDQIKKRGIPGCVWGHYGVFRTFLSHDCPRLGECDFTYCDYPDHEKIDVGMEPSLRENLFLAMTLNGISLLHASWSLVCGAHTEEDIEKTVEAFDQSLARLQAEKIL